MFSDSIKQKEISFTSSVTQPISTYEIATVWNTSKDIRRKVSFSFEKAVTDHQLSVIKKQFKGQTIDSVNLDGDQNVTLSFVQKGSVSDCNKDFSALFPNSLMKSQAHFSFAGGKKVTFSDKISLPANQNGEKLHGHYVFASVNSKESVTVAVIPEKIVTNTVKQNTSTKAVSALIKSDENIHDLCDFELTGNRLELSYRGSTAASFWMGALRWMLPVVVLIVIGLFLIRKKVAIREMFGDLKKELAESVNSLIDRINKR